MNIDKRVAKTEAKVEKLSLAYELLKYEKTNERRLFVIAIILAILLAVSVGINIYVIGKTDDVEYIEQYGLSTLNGNNNYVGGNNNGTIKNN